MCVSSSCFQTPHSHTTKFHHPFCVLCILSLQAESPAPYFFDDENSGGPRRAGSIYVVNSFEQALERKPSDRYCFFHPALHTLIIK